MYPVSWNIPLSILLTIFYCFLLLKGLKKKEIHILKIFLGLIVIVLKAALAGFLVYFLWKWIGPLHPEFGLYYFQAIFKDNLYLIGFIALGISVIFLYHQLISKKIGVFNLVLAGLLLWLIITWTLVFILPSGAFLFMFPLFFMLTGLTFILFKKKISILTSLDLLAISILCLPGVYLFTQAFYMLFNLMTLYISSGLVALLVLFTGITQFHISIITRKKPWLITILGFVVFLIIVSANLISRSSNELNPKPNTIFYAFDADSNKAFWATSDRKLDSWTSQFFPGEIKNGALPQFIPLSGFSLIYGPAPITQIIEPILKIESEDNVDSFRIIRAQIISNSPYFFINTDSINLIYDIKINGKSLEDKKLKESNHWPLLCFGFSDEPLNLELKTKMNIKCKLRVIKIVEDLPLNIDERLKPRPKNMIPRSGFINDCKIIGKSFYL
jgi:hypothetical protein